MRKIVYIILILIMGILVFFKIKIIKAKESKKNVSIAEEWKTHGIPVDVILVEKSTAYSYKKVSGILKQGNIIEADIPEEFLSTLKRGQLFTAHRDDQTLEGHIQRINYAGDVTTGLYRIRLVLHGNNSVSPGTIVSAKVKINKYYNIVKLPKTAIFTEDHVSYCWVIADNKAEKRNIKIGKDFQDSVQIVTGIIPGETVCALTTHTLTDGIKVRIRHSGTGK